MSRHPPPYRLKHWGECKLGVKKGVPSGYQRFALKNCYYLTSLSKENRKKIFPWKISEESATLSRVFEVFENSLKFFGKRRLPWLFCRKYDYSPSQFWLFLSAIFSVAHTDTGMVADAMPIDLIELVQKYVTQNLVFLTYLSTVRNTRPYSYRYSREILYDNYAQQGGARK